MTDNVEALAREIAQSRGVVPDALVTRYIMAHVDGLTILPPKEACREAWHEYVPLAELSLKWAARQGAE